MEDQGVAWLARMRQHLHLVQLHSNEARSANMRMLCGPFSHLLQRGSQTCHHGTLVMLMHMCDRGLPYSDACL